MSTSSSSVYNTCTTVYKLRLSTLDSVSLLSTLDSVSLLSTLDSVSLLSTLDSVSLLSTLDSVSLLSTLDSVSLLSTLDSVSLLCEMLRSVFLSFLLLHCYSSNAFIVHYMYDPYIRSGITQQL